MASLLSVENLQVQFQTKKGVNTAVDGVSFSIEKGRILGIVGESGCGKSVTSMSILQLLGSNARISGGSIKLDGKELVGLPEKEMCKIRGNDIAMIFQDPMTALNPTLTIGNQLMEPIMLHQNCNKKEAWTRAVDVLKRVGIAAPEKRMKEYPHQLSGGMRQRVMIAMAVFLRAAPFDRGRAHHSAGRNHPGTDPGADVRAPGKNGNRDHAHHPRYGRSCRDCG